MSRKPAVFFLVRMRVREGGGGNIGITDGLTPASTATYHCKYGYSEWFQEAHL